MRNHALQLGLHHGLSFCVVLPPSGEGGHHARSDLHEVYKLGILDLVLEVGSAPHCQLNSSGKSGILTQVRSDIRKLTHFCFLEVQDMNMMRAKVEPIREE
ncbi:hypothetical protein Vafri_16169 [Volvox africanus]|nr:hypothetical protein Vafri_16169 [Volvox africanus]